MSDPHSQYAVTALRGSLTRPRVHLAYRLGLILVAIAMVLLPLIYIALIVVVGYLLYLYVQIAPVWFGLVPGGGAGGFIWRLLGFVSPIVAGVILILFMVKPLFARRAEAIKPLTLDPSREGDLFAFVHRLCDVVTAPRPVRIDVDCAVNASAAFERGGWGLRARRLVLTIGLPLVAGLDMRGLAGVLAHEFGHFAQGTGMRLSYVIRSVNGWFARVVYERDAWDERLELHAARADFRIGLMLHLSRFFVWLTRRVLWALMIVGHAISCYMLRQMEFDADRYEVRLSGSEAFERTMLRFTQLNVAGAQAFEILKRSWDEGHLPEDLAELIVRLADRLPAEIRAKIEEEFRSEKTGFFDTHPAGAQRIARVKRQPDEGILRVEGPATTVFHEFETLSREATLKYYRDVLGDDVEGARLVPVDATMAADEVLRDQLAALGRIFAEGLSILRPLWLPAETSRSADWERDLAALRDGRRAMSERALVVGKAIEKYAKEDERRILATGARLLLETKVEFAAGDFGLEKGTEAAVEEARREAEAGQTDVLPDVDAYLESVRTWLGTALRLIHHPRGAEYVGQSTPSDQKIGSLLQALSCLQEAHPDFLTLRETFITLGAVLHAVSGRVLGEEIGKRVDELVWQLRVTLRTLRENLPAPYPFEHARGAIRIGDQVVGLEIANLQDIATLFAQAGAAQERYQLLYFRLLGILTQAAETLESGLRPGNAPDDAP